MNAEKENDVNRSELKRDSKENPGEASRKLRTIERMDGPGQLVAKLRSVYRGQSDQVHSKEKGSRKAVIAVSKRDLPNWDSQDSSEHLPDDFRADKRRPADSDETDHILLFWVVPIFREKFVGGFLRRLSR